MTILFLGLDYDWAVGGSNAQRSDTMILFTLDPGSKTAGMLSIPRDMWVHIPGFDDGKINTAYFLGQTYNLPGRRTWPGHYHRRELSGGTHQLLCTT